MTEGEHGLVVQQDARVLFDGDVGDVGDVQPVLLDKTHEGVLASEKVASALPVAIGPVIGDDPCP